MIVDGRRAARLCCLYFTAPSRANAKAAAPPTLAPVPVMTHALPDSLADIMYPPQAEIRALRDCYASLTPRERQVMALVASGLLNKQVGGELNISEITVKAHRGQVMRKMKADSLADLVTMAARLRLPRAPKA
jgi:DNA-binding NarL/FixJ family response regulator